MPFEQCVEVGKAVVVSHPAEQRGVVQGDRFEAREGEVQEPWPDFLAEAFPVPVKDDPAPGHLVFPGRYRVAVDHLQLLHQAVDE